MSGAIRKTGIIRPRVETAAATTKERMMKKTTRARLKREAAAEAKNENMPIGHTPVSITIMVICAIMFLLIIFRLSTIEAPPPSGTTAVVFIAAGFIILGIPFGLAWASRSDKKREYLKERERDIYEKKCLEQEEEANDE